MTTREISQRKNLEQLTIQERDIYDSKHQRINAQPIGKPTYIYFDGSDENFEEALNRIRPINADAYMTGISFRLRSDLPIFVRVLNYIKPVQFYKRLP